MNRRLERLKALYAELPTIKCQRKCVEACGPVAMTSLEWKHIMARLGYAPHATPDLPAIQSGDLSSLTCPMLDKGLCTVYEQRPLICRLYGVAEGLRCPWGCEPSRLLTRAEASAFLSRATAIAGDL